MSRLSGLAGPLTRRAVPLRITHKLYNLHVMRSRLDQTFAALADPTRRAILARLALGEATVAELSAPFGVSQPAISRHLKVLEAAGMIEAGQAAQTRPRRLKPGALDEAQAYVAQLRSLWSDRLDRLDAFLNDDSTHPAGDQT